MANKRDTTYGRQGGRVEKWKPMPGLVARIECGCGTAVVMAKDVGRRCPNCQQENRLLGEPWMTDGAPELGPLAVEAAASEAVTMDGPTGLADAREALTGGAVA